jgi:hypothetical protein
LRVWFVFSCLAGLCLAACGIESEIPSDSRSTPTTVTERAVFITSSVKTATGTIVTCELNEVLVSSDLMVPLFLEYEGTEIERTHMTNESTFTFAEFNPPADGHIVCVVELADAEFESENYFLERVP